MRRRQDTDAILRTWFAEGSERAPDWAVWRALDEIERSPQRPPWRTRLERADRGFRAASRLLRVAAVVALLVLPIALIRHEGPGGPPAHRSYEIKDLAAIVVSEDTMPAGWTLDSLNTSPSQVLVIPVRTMPLDKFLKLPALAGYRGGRYTDFSGSDAVFISWAILFENPRQATGAMEVYAVELGSESGWGLGSSSPVDLGDAGAVFEGGTLALVNGMTEPAPMRIYLWRAGNLVLATAGWFEYDSAELLEVARGMDSRAR